MYTEAQIRDFLTEDPNWTPGEDASDADWEMYEKVRDDMEEEGILGSSSLDEGLGDSPFDEEELEEDLVEEDFDEDY